MNLIIRKLRNSDTDAAGAIVAASMMVEPGYVAVLPDEGLRSTVLRDLVTDSARGAIAHGAAYGVFEGDRLVGASLWLPPDTYPPPAPSAAEGPAPLPSYLSDLDPEIVQGLITYDERCVHHFPDLPAWYLMYLGIDPARQGIGAGSVLLRESLAAVLARELAPAYLETGTERNVRFYERFGFEVREAGVQLVPGPARHWTMMRPARPVEADDERLATRR